MGVRQALDCYTTMSLIHLVLRAAVLLGLAAAFLVMFLNGLSLDSRPAPPPEDRSAPAATPSPTAPSLPPPQAQLCNRVWPPPALTEIEVPGASGQVIARAYCSGTDLEYVTYVDQHGVVERTYLFEDGAARVKLYHNDGVVVKREDFDQEGNLVPDGTYFSLPNSRIGPGLTAGQP
jgi:hypothetical protein